MSTLSTRILFLPVNPCYLTQTPAMYAHNVLAVLIPCEHKARTAFGLEQNENRFHKAVGGIAEEATIDSREPTPAQLPPSEGDFDVPDRILLSFDQPPKNPLCGWQFGTNKHSSDILLGFRGTKGVSSRQYNITIDEKFCVWLHDFYSSHGTAVGYDHEHQDEIRKGESWILFYEPGNSKQWKDIRIHSGGLTIKIEFPNHKEQYPQYMQNLRAFSNQSQTTIPPIDILGLESSGTTAAPSQPLTPIQRPIYLNDELIGRGQFGEVHRVIKARDGKYFASKKFITPTMDPKGSKKGKRDQKYWLERIRNEIAIMETNPHVSALRSTHLTSQI